MTADYTELLTSRLRLAAVTIEDLDQFHELHSDPDTYGDEPEAMHPDRAHSRSLIETFITDWASWKLGYWSVRLRETGDYIGCAGVRRNDENWNVYYRLTPSVWGNGYAAEVIRAAADCAEQIEPGALLQAVMRTWNTKSERVAEQLGMAYCGSYPDYGGIEDLIYQLPAAQVRRPPR